MTKLSDLLSSSNPEKRYLSLANGTDYTTGGQVVFPASTHGLAAEPTVFYSNLYFAPRLKGLPSFERSLFGTGRLSGRSESKETQAVFVNTDGGLDFLYYYAWSGRRFDFYIGGPDFAFSDFGLIMSLVLDEPTFSDDSISFSLKDISTLFDTEVQTERYAGTGGAEGSADLANRLKPEVYGCCRKVSPVFLGVDSGGRNSFGVGGGYPIVGVLDLWDRGSSLIFTTGVPNPGEWSVDLSTGTITLGGSFVGPIQVDVLGRRYLSVPSSSTVTIGTGVRSFTVTAGADEQQIATGMMVRCLLTSDPSGTWMDGVVTSPRPGSTLNVNVSSFRGAGSGSSWLICPWGTVGGIIGAIASKMGLGDYVEVGVRNSYNYTQPATAGYWMPQGGNGLQTLDMMAEGGGSYWYITRINTLRVGRIDPPDVVSSLDLDQSTIMTLERVSTEVPSWSYTVKYGHRWSTLSTDQIAGVANPTSFVEEWQAVTGIASDAKSVFPTSKEIVIESLFDLQVDAQNEVIRQYNLFYPRRNYFKVTTKRAFLSVSLGMTVFVTYPRYGLNSGKMLRVVDIKEDYDADLVEIGVWG